MFIEYLQLSYPSATLDEIQEMYYFGMASLNKILCKDYVVGCDTVKNSRYKTCGKPNYLGEYSGSLVGGKMFDVYHISNGTTIGSKTYEEGYIIYSEDNPIDEFSITYQKEKPECVVCVIPREIYIAFKYIVNDTDDCNLTSVKFGDLSFSKQNCGCKTKSRAMQILGKYKCFNSYTL